MNINIIVMLNGGQLLVQIRFLLAWTFLYNPLWALLSLFIEFLIIYFIFDFLSISIHFILFLMENILCINIKSRKSIREG
jgi:hypothetical protein